MFMQVKTGIFWIVHGEIMYCVDVKTVDDATRKDFVNYNQSHFEMWDVVSKGRFPYSDFATFPRGRLLYDVNKAKYYLYIDPCITNKQVKQLVQSYELRADEYEMLYDEHYSCDKCAKF